MKFNQTILSQHKKFLSGLLLFACSMMNFHALALNTSDELRHIVKHKIDAEHQGVGVAVVLINDSQVEYINVGYANKAENTKVDSNTLFEIGSITKTFTTTALANMVNEGKVALTDPVSKYLPSFVNVRIKGDKPMTLLSLANHSSGLPSLPSNLSVDDPLNPYASYTVENMYEFLNTYQPQYEVGSQHQYSNFGMGLLGHILSLVDNKSYEELLNDRVLEPLSMTSTLIEEGATKLPMSIGYDAQLNPTKYWQLSALAGAGGLRSNARDMAKYLATNMNKMKLESDMELTQKTTADFGNSNTQIGLAWMSSVTPAGKIYMHNGGTGGFRSYIGFNTETNKGIVILSNSVYSFDSVGQAYLLDALDTVSLSRPINLKNQQLQNLNGEFELAPGFSLTITNDKQRLYVQATGQGQLPLKALSEREFVNEQVQAKIVFELDDSGNASSLTMYQGGQTLSGKKLAKRTLKAENHLAKLNGKFELAPGFSLTITNDGHKLYVQATGQSRLPLVAVSDTEFVNRQVQAKIAFELDDDGNAKSLIMYQAGQTLPGKKIN